MANEIKNGASGVVEIEKQKSPDVPVWNDKYTYLEAQLGTKDDGVSFCITSHPTCYRRGKWRLLVEVCGGVHHHDWSCFDEQDQPMRWYHSKENALSEAQAIASVLWSDRQKEAKNKTEWLDAMA